MDDPDNVLEDEFVINAMDVVEGGESDDDDDWEDGSDVDSDCGGGRSEEDDDVPSLQSWGGEETGTKFTNYSMSSSCIRRNNQLSLLDDKFDKFMDQYGEFEESGDRMKLLIKESEKEKALTRQQLEREREVQKNMLEESEDESEMEKRSAEEHVGRK